MQFVSGIRTGVPRFRRVLSRYMRLSAVASSVSYESPSCGKMAAPILIVIWSSWPAFTSNRRLSTAPCSSSRLRATSSLPHLEDDDDSSPAYRTQMS